MSTAVLDSAVLVLNKFYQAVHVTTVRRAFSLFFRGHVKAVDEEYLTYSFNDWKDLPPEGDVIHTPAFTLRVPRVVLLVYYELVPQFRIRFSRKNIFIRDRNACQYCGGTFDYKDLSLDHVIPTSRGGGNSWENLVCCCIQCNKKKGHRSPAEAGMTMVRKPKKPHWIPFSRFKRRSEEYDQWKNFIDFAYWNVPLDEDMA